MFIVSSVGATVLRAEEEFIHYIAPEMKLEDPYARKRKIKFKLERLSYRKRVFALE